MGGKDASRGFLYQGFAAVLESLTQDGWDHIYVEFPTEGDKVDIALEYQRRIIKSIQVKSTINTFSKASIITWINDLVADVSSSEYQICLIGQCDKDAILFLNSIQKYQDNIIDDVSRDSLKSFDTKLLDGNKISTKILPFDLKSLLSIIRDNLNRYIFIKGYKISFEQAEIISEAVISLQMLLSTNGSSMEKDNFDEKIFQWIKLMGGPKLQKLTSSATHNLQFYNLGDKTFSEKIAPIQLKDYVTYKNHISKIVEKCSEYIKIISPIKLPAYSDNVQKSTEVNLENIVRNNHLFSAIGTPSIAEMSNKKKTEMTEEARNILGIEISPGFFNVGNLTKRENYLEHSYELVGKQIEKDKYNLLWDLSYEFTKYDIAQFFCETFSEYILIPIAILNNSPPADNDITIQVFIDSNTAEILSPDEYPKNDCSQALANIICRDKLIDQFLSLPKDSKISIEDEIYREPLRKFNIFEGEYEYTSEDFYDILARYVATAEYEQGNNSVCKFNIRSLRPNEVKWIGKLIIVKPLQSEIPITYRILSNHSDGTISGILKVSD